jgi:ribonuclease E
MREDGESEGPSAFFWVRGRTPSLEDPYVWFDPLNPQPRAEREPDAVVEAAADDQTRGLGRERAEADGPGEREGGRRRRRRGRGRGAERLTAEGGTEVGDGAAAVDTTGDEDTVAPSPATPEIAPEPQRRRVRRKTAAVADAAVDEDVVALEPADVAITPDAEEDAAPGFTPETEVEPAPEPIAAVTPEPEPEPAPLPTPAAAPVPARDLSEIIANDPAQITAPPPKPKRGWWRL